MSRTVKLLAAPLAAGAVLLATATPAPAQGFMIRPTPPGYNPMVSRFMFGGMMFPSPTGGYGFRVQKQYFYQNNLVRPYNITPPYDPKLAYSYAFGYAGSMRGGVNALAAREQFAVMQAQRDARDDAGARQQLFDQWAAERGTRRLDPNRLKDAAPALRDAVLNPSDADVASGKALNELLKAIQELEAKGARAETPFLPPEVLDKVAFAGGPAADALNLLRANGVEFPAALRGPEFDALRGAIEADVAAAHARVRNGKPIDVALLDRIEANARKLKAKAIPPADAGTDAAAAAGFLDRLSGAAKHLKTAEGGAVFVPAWRTVGVSLSDLSKYLGRQKINFGPAAAGNDAAYSALHRGMVGYLNQLTEVKR